MKANSSRFVSANLPVNKFKNRLVNILPCKCQVQIFVHKTNIQTQWTYTEFIPYRNKFKFTRIDFVDSSSLFFFRWVNTCVSAANQGRGWFRLHQCQLYWWLPLQEGIHCNTGTSCWYDGGFLENVVGTQFNHYCHADQTQRNGQGKDIWTDLH